MPITINNGGVLHELTDVAVNVGGTLHALDAVHANVAGVLWEIFSGCFPSTLNWSNGAVGLSVNASGGNGKPVYAEFGVSKVTKVTVSCKNNGGTYSTGQYAILDSSDKEIVSKSWTQYTESISAVLPAGTYRIRVNGGGMSGTYPNLTPSGYDVTLNVSFSKG